MKKIMFNDHYGLTEAVLEGRKTMTRRVVSEKLLEAYYDYDDYVCAVAPRDIPCTREYEQEFFLRRSPFEVGEIVAVAQSLRDMGYDPRDAKHKSGAIWGLDHTPAWTNKMFVSASECIHHIRIADVRVERLQDISGEDCLREGIFWDYGDYPYMATKMYKYNEKEEYTHPKAAFAALIDKISGKGTWGSNPWVFVYEFELVKRLTNEQESRRSDH